ncbi:malyl-CoA thiolesterase [Thalassobacter stenotrophicus]|uniref:HpcH/HpaI aldolase/citrate lyase family protein n=1 Tax=Thalassobacter TaxID=266808 RepID=UPI00051F8DBD|nr:MULTISPECIES: CoA ester lyase [Thalassobacter]KGK79568.1 malyl-CoA thiolesterase [Thalassobacter stenotrophicus]
MTHPYRSVLYIPGSKERALEKAKTLPVDAIIFDLEDAVAVDEKENARHTLAAALTAGGYGDRAQIVRINALDTDWGHADVAVIAPTGPQAVLLPKVNSAADIKALSALLDAHPACADTKIWAMMESPLGILNALEIAQAPRMGGFILGTNDLAKDLNTRFRADREPLLTSLQMCLLAARAAGIVCVDGVYNAFKDAEGLAAECAQGRDMGMDGKTLIHPAQVDVCNTAFSPSEAEIDLARRQIDAFEAAEAEGLGIAVVDGKIVENLHVETARKTLAMANAIATAAE